MTDYTRKEKEAIRSGWNALRTIIERTDMRMGYRMREALKHEKRERSCLHTARALVIDSFLEGYDGFEGELSDLYTYADGCMVAILCGARAKWFYTLGQRNSVFERSEREEKHLKLDIESMRAAVAAHKESIDRRWKAV